MPTVLSDLVNEFERKCKEIGKPGDKWQWHQNELRRFFKSSILRVVQAHPVWFFVDALDECADAADLLRWLKDLLQTLPSNSLKCHICIACRDYPILSQRCGFEIYADRENKNDITTYIRAQFHEYHRLATSSIPDLITGLASGLFMWARLVVDHVRELEDQGNGLKRIEKAIRCTPSELDDLYYKLVKDMSKNLASLKLIQWIYFAPRPLSLDELRWAMIVEADSFVRSLLAYKDKEDFIPDDEGLEKQVRTLSCGLVEVTGSTIKDEDMWPSDIQVVQFIHQSVKDFFIEKGLLVLQGSSTSTDVIITAHYQLSRICIRYLAIEEIAQSINQTPRVPAHSYRDYISTEFSFLHYATTSWVTYTKQCDASDLQDDLLDLFAWPSNAFVVLWLRSCYITGHSQACFLYQRKVISYI